MVQRALDRNPDDADLQLLLAASLLALDRHRESRRAVRRAIECGGDDPTVLVRAGSMCFFSGELEAARECVERVRRLQPRGFIFASEVKELERSLTRRERGLAAEKRLSAAFNADPADREVTLDFARHLVRTGRAFSAYHVVTRGLLYHPGDGALRGIERKLRGDVPATVRAEAEEWARSGEPSTIP